MVTGDVAGHAKKLGFGMRGDGGIQGAGADFRVHLHDLEFLPGELARLEQNAVGNADFADVVQGAGHVHHLDEIAVDFVAELVLAGEVLGQHAAILADPLQVGAGLRIARLGQLRHAEDEQLAALQGENPLAGADSSDKLLHGEGLVDEVVRAGVHGVDDELRALPRGEQDEVDVTAGRPLADFSAELDPAHLGHHPVGDYQAELSAANQLEGLVAVVGDAHLVSELRQRVFQDFCRDVVVVNDQDFHGGCSERSGTHGPVCGRHLNLPAADARSAGRQSI